MRKITKATLVKCLFAPRERVLLIDAGFFFTENFVLVQKHYSRRELDRLVALHIETICPFALDDILYGYFVHKSERRLTIFIAYKQKIENVYGQFTKFNYIFPDFLCDLTSDRSFNLKQVKIVGDFICFTNTNEKLKFRLSDRVIYCANLLPRSIKSSQFHMRLYSRFLKIGFCCCLFSVVLLFAGIIITSVKYHKLSRFITEVEYNRETVSEITSKNNLLLDLEKFYDNDDFCLSGLNFINQIRLNDILFTDVHAYSETRTLKIKGHAGSIVSIMSYKDGLIKLSGIKQAIVSHVHSKDNANSFDLEVQFE